MSAPSALLACLNDSAPHARLLSNGRYSVLLTGAGSGYSACSGYALTAWGADRTEDADGFFVFLRDLEANTLWSAGHQPVGTCAQRYTATYAPGRMVIDRTDVDIETRLAVCVAPEDDVEIRTVTVRNLSSRTRRIDLTSYAEIVLHHAAAHAAHPAFAKLFVQTEYVATPGLLLAHRRPRSHDEQTPWMLHALSGSGSLQHETDRARFLGRGCTRARPAAMASAAALSGTVGNVLDPVFSLRRMVELDAGGSASFTFLLAAGPSRTALIDLARRYNDPTTVAAAFEAASRYEGALLQRLGIEEQRAQYWQDLAGAMLYGDPRLRADPGPLRRAHAAWLPSVGPAVAATLQRYGVGGDGLRVAVHVDGPSDHSLVGDLLQARTYWQAKGLDATVLALCADSEVPTLSAVGATVLRRSEIPADDVDLMLASAHLVVRGDFPGLGGTNVASVRGARFRACTRGEPPQRVASGPLALDNDHGGFTADGREYVVRVDQRRPPMPWVNVVANERFGFLVSESGAGYTWSENSRENRLTPWYNDPIADPYGEALYIRDEDAGMFWSPLPGPVPGAAAYEARHGYGYTQWHHDSEELEQEVCQFVAQDDPVKLTRLRLRNIGDRQRRLSIFAYYRLVLGVLPEESGRFVATEVDAESAIFLARNTLNNEFADRVVFAAAVAPDGTERVCFTGDRTAFLGRNGTPEAPAAVCNALELDGRTGTGLDPCAAVQVTVSVPPHSTIECVFFLGAAADAAGARTLVERYRLPGAARLALDEVRDFWAQTLSAVEVKTPSAAIDLMVNGWLLYQALSCRLWGRSAFYQSGGAFGYRDQLQDSAALIYTRPDLTRAQLRLHAAHQFVEGDVLHWWHPPADRGTRTHFSDDLLWLPYLTASYVRTTGDWSVLDEAAGYVTARPLQSGEDETYLIAQRAADVSDLYTHCCLALDRSLTRGAHGLPLMGTGDWNDGMNRVGREGRGESVWLGFFLYRILQDFIPICERRADRTRVERYRAYQSELRAALNDGGWDGAWYRRAYYDDGTPLGSAHNEECRIDALAQAWAVLSQAAPPQRATQAMEAVERQLVSTDAGLIRLLTPPFDRDAHDPGYIKGYVPGIRENGGQYTHAAIWVVQAIAELGWRDRATTYLEMLTPIHHSRTPEQVAVYQVEPYVVAADIYGVTPHVGRGGWTWYTGAAGWMYRVALESILGFRVEDGNTLRLKPCVPDTWREFTIAYRLRDQKTQYTIEVRNPSGSTAAVNSVLIDGRAGTVEDGAALVPLLTDGTRHDVRVTLGS